MTSTFGERLEQALAFSQRDRAGLIAVLRGPNGKLGISSSALSQVLTGGSKAMSAENCVRAARYLGVSSWWLATGEGPMVEHAPTTQAEVREELATYRKLTDDALLSELAQLLARVPVHIRAPFADVLHGWAMSGAADDRRPALLALLDLAPRRAVA